MTRKFCYITASLLMMSFWFSHASLFAEPIDLHNHPLEGEYIGTHIEFLNEREVFQVLSKDWEIKNIFKEKMLSGEHHSDDIVAFDFKQTPLGYSSALQLSTEINQSQIVTWGIEDILKEDISSKFIQSDKNILSFSFIPHAYWLRFQIANESLHNIDLVLELDFQWLFDFDLFILNEHGELIKKSSLTSQLNERELGYKNFAVPTSVPSGITSYYFRINGPFFGHVPLRFWSKREFSKHILLDSTLFGIFAGGLLFLFLYNLIIFVSVKDPSYIYLALMTISQLILSLCGSGFGFQFLWPQNFVVGVDLLYWTFPLSFVFFLLFCRSFIDLPQHTPKTDRMIVFMIYFFIMIALLFFVLPESTRHPILFAMATVEYFYFIAIVFPAIIAIRKGNRAGLFLMVGISLHFLSSLEGILSLLDIIPYHFINYLNIKGPSFLIIMTLALTHKLHSMKKELTHLNVHLENEVILRTERLSKKTEELEQTNEKLKELDKLKTRFFSNISHELRTPLTLILAPIDSFLNGTYGEMSQTHLKILQSIQRNTHRLLKLINDLLDFSKIEAGKMELKVRNCNISDLLSYCVASVESGAISQKINLSFHDHTQSLVVQMDPDLMEKAIFNLLSNAMKFNHAGGMIRVELKKDQERFTIAVKDSGIGIPEDKIATIFERFTQVDSSSTRKYEGTGIGLSLTKEIVQLHEGQITVESELGKGSLFTLDLPILFQKTSTNVLFNREEDHHLFESNGRTGDSLIIRTSPDEEENPSGCSHPPENIQKKTETILVIEDNEDMRNYLHTNLQENYRTLMASNGHDALEKIKTETVDLILTDVMMPEMDGYEFIQTLRAEDRYADVPVIFLTAKSDVLNKVEGLEKGANDYITKPFSYEELLVRITSQLKCKALRKKLFESTLRSEKNKKPLTDKTKLRIEMVKEFLQENYADDISREGLAAAVEMSPDHLGRMFKECVGEKISDYLNKIRIEKALKKLRESDESITNIAFDVGFGNLRTFNKTFQDRIGTTPSNYRKSQKQILTH